MGDEREPKTWKEVESEFEEEEEEDSLGVSASDNTSNSNKSTPLLPSASSPSGELPVLTRAHAQRKLKKVAHDGADTLVKEESSTFTDPLGLLSAHAIPTQWKERKLKENEKSPFYRIVDDKFSTAQFLADVHSETSWEKLVKGHKNIGVKIKSRENTMLAFVKDNFEVFVRTRDSLLDIESGIAELGAGLEKGLLPNLVRSFQGVVQDVKKTFIPFLEREKELTRIRSLIDLTVTSRSLLIAFTSFKRNIKDENYRFAFIDCNRLTELEVLGNEHEKRVFATFRKQIAKICADLLKKLEHGDIPVSSEIFVVRILRELDIESETDPITHVITLDLSLMEMLFDAPLPEDEGDTAEEILENKVKTVKHWCKIVRRGFRSIFDYMELYSMDNMAAAAPSPKPSPLFISHTRSASTPTRSPSTTIRSPLQGSASQSPLSAALLSPPPASPARLQVTISVPPQVTITTSDQQSDKDLLKEMIDRRSGVPRETRMKNGKLYLECFKGDQIADWLVSQKNMSRQKARACCQQLMRESSILLLHKSAKTMKMFSRDHNYYSFKVSSLLGGRRRTTVVMPNMTAQINFMLQIKEKFQSILNKLTSKIQSIFLSALDMDIPFDDFLSFAREMMTSMSTARSVFTANTDETSITAEFVQDGDRAITQLVADMETKYYEVCCSSTLYDVSTFHLEEKWTLHHVEDIGSITDVCLLHSRTIENSLQKLELVTLITKNKTLITESESLYDCFLRMADCLHHIAFSVKNDIYVKIDAQADSESSSSEFDVQCHKLLLVMNNCKYIRKKALAVFSERFHEVFEKNVDQLKIEEINDVLIVLEEKIVYNIYVREKIAQLSRTLCDGIPITYEVSPTPSCVRSYVLQVLTEMMKIHAEICHTSHSWINPIMVILTNVVVDFFRKAVDDWQVSYQPSVPELNQLLFEVSFVAIVLETYHPTYLSNVKTDLEKMLPDNNNNNTLGSHRLAETVDIGALVQKEQLKYELIFASITTNHF